MKHASAIIRAVQTVGPADFDAGTQIPPLEARCMTKPGGSDELAVNLFGCALRLKPLPGLLRLRPRMGVSMTLAIKPTRRVSSGFALN